MPLGGSEYSSANTLRWILPSAYYCSSTEWQRINGRTKNAGDNFPIHCETRRWLAASERWERAALNVTANFSQNKKKLGAFFELWLSFYLWPRLLSIRPLDKKGFLWREVASWPRESHEFHILVFKRSLEVLIKDMEMGLQWSPQWSPIFAVSKKLVQFVDLKRFLRASKRESLTT